MDPFLEEQNGVRKKLHCTVYSYVICHIRPSIVRATYMHTRPSTQSMNCNTEDIRYWIMSVKSIGTFIYLYWLIAIVGLWWPYWAKIWAKIKQNNYFLVTIMYVLFEFWTSWMNRACVNTSKYTRSVNKSPVLHMASLSLNPFISVGSSYIIRQSWRTFVFCLRWKKERVLCVYKILFVGE